MVYSKLQLLYEVQCEENFIPQQQRIQSLWPSPGSPVRGFAELLGLLGKSDRDLAGNAAKVAGAR